MTEVTADTDEAERPGQGQELLAPARPTPPTGSVIVLEASADGLVLEWPAVGGPAFSLWSIAAMATVIPSPMTAWLIYLRLRPPKVRLTLSADGLELTTPRPIGRRTRRWARGEVSAIELARPGRFLRLALVSGQGRVPLGELVKLPVLSEAELEWLYAQLEAWRED